MTEISEEVLVAEAQVVASRLVEWFRERVLISEAQLDAAVAGRVSAEDEQRVAEAQRDAAVAGRVSAEDEQRVAEEQRAQAQRRVIEVERLLIASEELAQQLQHALDARIVIEQAKGFLAAQHGVTPEQALEAMRRHARSNRVKLHDVAGEVLAGTASLSL